MKWSVLAITSLSTLFVHHEATAKPVENQGPADLSATSITLKIKADTVKNATLHVTNNGGKALNSVVEFYLSEDETLTTTPDELTSTADLLLHRVSLGTVQAGRTKKKTLGGGHLKKADVPTSGKILIGLVDAENSVAETTETNNLGFSPPLP